MVGLVGYSEVVGLDISEGLLAVVRRKNCYRKLIRLALRVELHFADGTYAGVVSAGVFTTGHVGAEAMDELARQDGVLVVTVKTPIWDDGFQDHAQEIGFGLVEVMEPYVSMPDEEGTVPSVPAVFFKV